MSIEEIFTKLISHMKEGVCFHEEFARAYDFLGLWGFSKCQIYHEQEELQEYHRLYHYYATHYFKLIQIQDASKKEIIPTSWYKYVTQNVDINTKRNAIKELITKWIDWEQSTKKLYQEMWQKLTEINELDAARKVDQLIHSVSSELHDIEKLKIKLETINYELITILEWSDDLHKKYKKKLGW